MNMKRHTWMILAAGLACLGACNNDALSIVEETDGSKVTCIRAAESEAATKASIDNDDATFAWTADDAIAVYANGYKKSYNIMDVSGNSATFRFLDLEESNRANFAIFPASLVFNGDNPRYTAEVTSSNLKLYLPGEYDIAEVSGELSPCPMIATNAANGALEFKHICALFRISLIGVPKAATKVTFDFDGKKVQGEFTLTDVVPGTTSVVTSATAGTDDVLTITGFDENSWKTLQVVNLPLPTGTYHNVTVTALDKNNAVVKTETISIRANNQNWEPDRLSSRKREYSFKTIGGLYIAPGNLYTDAEGNICMADNPCEHFVYWSNNFTAATYDATAGKWPRNRTHFSWLEMYRWMMKDEIPTSVTYTTFDEDVAKGAPFTGSKVFEGHSWHVPTTADWFDISGYTSNGSSKLIRAGSTVIGTETYENVCFVKVIVSDFKDGDNLLGYSSSDGETVYDYGTYNGAPYSEYQAGLLLFPDGATLSVEGVSLSDYNKHGTTGNLSDSPYKTNPLTMDSLRSFLAGGCAFLPVANRWNSDVPEAQFTTVGVDGHYQSSTYATTIGNALFFSISYNNLVNVTGSGGSFGVNFRSVRLVR